MFIWLGAATCLYAAFAVGNSGLGVIIIFIFSKNENDVKAAFGTNNLQVFTSSIALLNHLKVQNWKEKNLLMMSSGNFDGINFKELAKTIIN